MGKYSLKSLPWQGVARVLWELFSAELEIMVVVKLPEFNVNDIEILVAEEIRVSIDIWLYVDVLQTFENFWIFELSG